MGQIAHLSNNQKVIEAFSLSDEEWSEVCNYPRGSLLMPRTGWPAVAKTSIRGLRFFAHYPGYSGILPKPESYAHTRLKIDVVKAARAIGYNADLEVYGEDHEGSSWIADVIITHPNKKRIAIEIQLSSQHLRDFRKRTERYNSSSIDCYWINSEKPVGLRLAKALCYENHEYYKTHNEFMADSEDLITFGVNLENKNTYPENPPLLRFSRGNEMRRLSIGEAIRGIFIGMPQWREPYWHWGTPLEEQVSKSEI